MPKRSEVEKAKTKTERHPCSCGEDTFSTDSAIKFGGCYNCRNKTGWALEAAEEALGRIRLEHAAALAEQGERDERLIQAWKTRDEQARASLARKDEALGRIVKLLGPLPGGDVAVAYYHAKEALDAKAE